MSRRPIVVAAALASILLIAILLTTRHSSSASGAPAEVTLQLAPCISHAETCPTVVDLLVTHSGSVVAQRALAPGDSLVTALFPGQFTAAAYASGAASGSVEFAVVSSDPVAVEVPLTSLTAPVPSLEGQPVPTSLPANGCRPRSPADGGTSPTPCP